MRVFVEIPEKVTKRQEELLREFAAIEDEHRGKRRGFFRKVRDFFGEE